MSGELIRFLGQFAALPGLGHCLWRIVFEAILVGCTQVAFDDHLCGDGMAGTGGVLPLVTGGGLGRHFVVSRRGNDVYAGGCDLCH